MAHPDPTVYVPYRVRIELARPFRGLDELERPADHVTLTPGFVFVYEQHGDAVNIPVDAVRSLSVVVGEAPADYRQLRERYRNAYDAWDHWTLERLQMSANRGRTVAQLAVQTRRPPEHLAAKARELAYELLEDGADAHDEKYVHPFVDGNYLVHVGRPPGSVSGPAPRTVDVLARSKIQPEDVYRLGWWGFAAHLAEPEAERIAADPDVRELEPDIERLAPHRRVPVEKRVPDHYIVSVRRTSAPLTVAARAGVVPDRIFDVLSNSFAADLTDEQLAVVRRDPEVERVEDDHYIWAD